MYERKFYKSDKTKVGSTQSFSNLIIFNNF